MTGPGQMRRDLAFLCVPAFLLAAWGGPPWFHPDSIVPRTLAATLATSFAGT